MNDTLSRADELVEAWTRATARPTPAFVGASPRTRPRRSQHAYLIGAVVILVLVLSVAAATMIGSSQTPSTPTPSTAPSPSTASATASPTASPSPTPALPAAVDGLPVHSVSELLAARAAGEAPGGPYALRDWTDRTIGHTCAPTGATGTTGPPPELEPLCHDGEWGITERDEPIFDVVFTRRAAWTDHTQSGTTGPRLTPRFSSDDVRLRSLPRVNGQDWPPVPIVVVGHFDDPRAADCRAEARQVCLDRFVIDRVVTFDPESVPAPTPTPIPSSTPFPVADPPPALFTNESCYDGVPKSFTGWIPFNDLHVQVEGPGYVYAMVTKDVIAIGEWYDSPYPGHKARAWGQGVCYAIEDGRMGHGWVTGTRYLEIDDGRHIVTP